MGWKEQFPSVQFYQNSAKGPQVRLVIPAQLQNHFWRAVLSSLDDTGVVFVREHSTAKVNDFDVSVDWELLLAFRVKVPLVVNEQNVFEFEIGMG
jgi:hypothetical protein